MSRAPLRPWLTIALAALAACAHQVVASEPAEAARASLRTKQFGDAVRALRMAAEQGDAESQYLLGLVYSSGTGAEVSLAEARHWLTAAVPSEADTCCNAAHLGAGSSHYPSYSITSSAATSRLEPNW